MGICPLWTNQTTTLAHGRPCPSCSGAANHPPIHKPTITSTPMPITSTPMPVPSTPMPVPSTPSDAPRIGGGALFRRTALPTRRTGGDDAG
eukprot:873283-Pyramimonas_sp.AAC.2